MQPVLALRRGILYRVAGELGATKIALGHHRDDMLQTLFMNMFFGSRLKGMPPKLVSDDGKNIVIRPLALRGRDRPGALGGAPPVPHHPLPLCGNQENLQRVQMKKMLRGMGAPVPGRLDNIFTAMGNIVPSHMMDRKLTPSPR